MKKLLLLACFFMMIAKTYASNEKYRLILTDNPATTMMIGWNQTSGSNPVVHYGTTDHGTNWNSYSNTKTVDRTVSYKGMSNTFAKLTGLTPNTAYYFVIRDSQGTSARFWFKTAPSTNDRMSFIAGGDSRNNRTPRQNANRLVSKLKPTAVFFGGDMTNGDSSSEWQDWFDDWQLTIASDGRMFPIIPARGNHEDSNNSIYHLFNTPSTNIYYDITFGNNLYTVYTLNSEITAGGSQFSWLNGELNANTSIWKSAQYHKPMRPHVGSKSEGNDEYSSRSQLFYDKGVNLVFESDSHTVKTTWAVRPCSSGNGCDEGFVRDDTNGTVYVGEGCWGAPLRSANDAKNWTRNSSSFNQFKWVFVEASKIEVRTVKVDNATSVGSVSNANPFTIPSSLDVWNPSNGSVVTILANNVVFPEVTITNPSSGATQTVGTPVTISANASDADGSVAKVEFYANNTLVGTDSTAPFSYNWTPTTNNQSYTIGAIAEDNEGNRTTATTVDIFVGTVNTTVTSRISAGDDDAEQYGSSGTMYMDSSDLELVNDGSKGNQHVGMLFKNLNIPADATITNAYIQFTVDETNSGTTNVSIKVENAGNAAAITSQNNNITSRSYYSQAVNWSPNAWNTVGAAGNDQQTPELKTLVQHIVNKSDWNTGNNMLFYISGTGERTAESYNGSSSNAPQLVVSYEVGNGGGGPTPGLNCASTQTSFPYAQGFNNNLSGWTQETVDDFNWAFLSGSTGSSGTGPTAPNEGSHYIYMESSSPNYATKRAILISPCMDVASVQSPELTFDYHLYGASNMGSLTLEITTDGTNWTSIWNMSGNQGNSWKTATIDLSSYITSAFQLRFNGVTGTTWKGDMAIDNLQIKEQDTSSGGGTPTPTCEDVSVTLVFDRYSSETSWTITNNSGTVVMSGDNYTQGDGETITVTDCLPFGCYDFKIDDDYGDGICCSYGNGSYSINSNGSVLISGGEFTRTETKQFCITNTAARNAGMTSFTKKEDMHTEIELTLYPNPASDKIFISTKETKLWNAVIFTITGKKIVSKEILNGSVDVSSLKTGVYIIKIYDNLGTQKLLKKIVVE